MMRRFRQDEIAGRIHVVGEDGAQSLKLTSRVGFEPLERALEKGSAVEEPDLDLPLTGTVPLVVVFPRILIPERKACAQFENESVEPVVVKPPFATKTECFLDGNALGLEVEDRQASTHTARGKVQGESTIVAVASVRRS
jgi:hypothetical protein